MHQTEKKLTSDELSFEFQNTINKLFDFTDKEEVLHTMDEFFMEFLLSFSDVEVKRDKIFESVLIFQHVYKIIRLAQVKPLNITGHASRN